VISFYIEDLALECAEWLNADGVAAKHDLKRPREVTLLNIENIVLEEAKSITVSLENYLIAKSVKHNE